ncbi:hypothetical protein DLE60_18855, partial [Micromonospora globispora]
MRQEEQQVRNEHPEAVRSAPVPVPPPADLGDGDRRDAARTDVPEDALDDRGTFDDPAVVGDRPDDRLDADRRTDEAEALDETRPDDLRETRAATADAEAADTDREGRPEFHEPAPVPTT